MSFLQLFPAVFSKKSRCAQEKAKSMNLGGNLSGDGYQNGGCLVVGAGGSPTMFTFKQEEASEHPENANILEEKSDGGNDHNVWKSATHSCL